jgi:PAS domain-containing protein
MCHDLAMTVEGLVTRLDSDGQELLDALLQSTAEAVYAVDHSGRVLFANPAAVSTLGFDSEDELLGRRRDGDARAAASRPRSRAPKT